MKFLIMVLLLSSPVAFAKNGFYPTRFSPRWKESMNPTQNKLLYYGGPVISNAKVTVVYWGGNVDAPTKAVAADFYTATLNSNIMEWLDQYKTTGKSLDGRDGTNQHIGKGQYVNSVTINPSFTGSTIDDTDIQAELQKQIDAGTLPRPDDNTLYMIYFPPGKRITVEGMGSCSEFCAYHSSSGTPSSNHFFYGVMPDLGGACSFGCGFGQHIANVTSISSHELFEAITDPFPTPGNSPAYPQAWNDTSGSEIGDLCSSGNTLRTAAGATFTLQSEFDNSAGSCTNRNWTAP